VNPCPQREFLTTKSIRKKAFSFMAPLIVEGLLFSAIAIEPACAAGRLAVSTNPDQFWQWADVDLNQILRAAGEVRQLHQAGVYPEVLVKRGKPLAPPPHLRSGWRPAGSGCSFNLIGAYEISLSARGFRRQLQDVSVWGPGNGTD
jgi:hypothetical protein